MNIRRILICLAAGDFNFKLERIDSFYIYQKALFISFILHFIRPGNPPFQNDLLKFPCVLFWPVCPAWSASQRCGRVNVSYTRLLMRPETKERADTIIDSVLRGSFTLCRATAGDMRGERAAAMRPQEINTLVPGLQTFLRSRDELTGWADPQILQRFLFLFFNPAFINIFY